MGSNLLESGDTFSQLAHDTNSLAAFNTVPGNSYMMVTPLLARDDKAGKTDAGDLLIFAVCMYTDYQKMPICDLHVKKASTDHTDASPFVCKPVKQ